GHPPHRHLLHRVGAPGRPRGAQHAPRPPGLRRGGAQGRRVLRRARRPAALPRQRGAGRAVPAPQARRAVHRRARDARRAHAVGALR
ncbi:MAG: Peptidase M48, Ste24p, partial [uncultured Gemmatimonadaceae bacterium]